MISPDNNAVNMEPDCSPEHQRVRKALQTLPKANCPVGFEFRLERRLAGKPVGGTRSGWSISWLGAGVGFATAMVLALFIFDFGSAPGTNPANISGTPTTIKTSGVQVEQPADVAKTTIESTAPVTAPEKTAEQLAASQDTMKDKTKPGTLPEGQYQTVGGQQSPR